MTSEKEIEKYLVKKVKERGGIAYKFSSPARRGVPDRLICLPGGELYFIEVKSKKGKLLVLQKEEMKKLVALGFSCGVVYSKKEVDLLFP